MNFTSESVAEGHPDKFCDRLSDEILDACLRENPRARVAIECLATKGFIVVAGETRGVEESIDPDRIDRLARATMRDIGYRGQGFHPDSVKIQVMLQNQSPEIAAAVDALTRVGEDQSEGGDHGGDQDQGAGDQGIMFGYACREHESLMPLSLVYAHTLLSSIAKARRSGFADELGPDAKSQITIGYEDGVPAYVDTVIVSHQHWRADLAHSYLEDIVREHAERVMGPMIRPSTKWHINPSGTFCLGGPEADTGLTGRKIVVDAYGGAAPHGGGCFSGKDASKVDRSGAYMARYIAKNIVAAQMAHSCLVQLAYAIGRSDPVAVMVKCEGAVLPDDKIVALVRELFPLRPRAIARYLGLEKPIFASTSAYGHFGRAPQKDGGFSWEGLNHKQALIDALAH